MKVIDWYKSFLKISKYLNIVKNENKQLMIFLLLVCTFSINFRKSTSDNIIKFGKYFDIW